MDDDQRFMEQALRYARRAEGRVSPRPPVGAVIVSPDGEVVGAGQTRRGRGIHAETVALQAAGDRARGATCYVTLEPCAHLCAPALIEAGIARVVSAVVDPNPKVDGEGHALLQRAGVALETGLLADDAAALIEPFTTWIATGRPFVTLKLAASLDGKIAAPDGTSRWISGEESRREVHELRRRVDAVMVGSGTVLADDPSLTFRLEGAEGEQPLRVVLDSSGRTPTDAKVRNDAAPTLFFSAGSMDGTDVCIVDPADGGVDLGAVLDELGRRDVCHVLVEGGPTLAGSLLAQGLVDRFRLYLAPKIVGGDAPGLFADGVKTLTDAWELRITDVRRVGDDVRIEAERR
jgi:diaminohydroxyphosphoribosylaminopyrimidine deaminase/5-amino-6-(5-phosphoribosylamino)uracil reductase